ncbi:MAG: uncharacterized protein JWM34_848 [Ilumatobacteraceae bacterium]|nr:uncharacterized protein [Ilumatobacteraceae bacterium]
MKRRAAQQRRATTDHRDDPFAALSVEQLVLASLNIFGDRSYPQGKLLELAASLNGRGSQPERVRQVGQVIDQLLDRHLDRLFEHGWQPADVAHHVKRSTSQRSQRLVVAAIGVHARRHGAIDRAPRVWLAQLDDLGLLDAERTTIVGVRSEPFAGWARAERLHEDDATLGGLQVLAAMQGVSALGRLVDPPSAWGATNKGMFAAPTVSSGEVDAKALKLIRSLLAKAEATNFEAEAATFTAKAQELMTRHSIDAAVLASAARGPGIAFGVESRRVHIDNPYADEKAVLLSIIADVNGARSVWSAHVGFCTVMGIPVDLQLTDLLFTSLLVQATKASAEATRSDRRLSTPSFRRAFLTAYAERVGERLETAKQHTAHAAETDYGDALLPILASRQAAVDAAFTEAFPQTEQMRSRSYNAAGWYAGRAAADLANLGAGGAITSG